VQSLQRTGSSPGLVTVVGLSLLALGALLVLVDRQRHRGRHFQQ
jgi:LPXTG-motif cell wall-anchored protein